MALEAWGKLIATGIEKNAALDLRAEIKTAPKPAVQLEPWWSPVGILQRLGVARDARKTPEELKQDPLSPAEKVGALLPSLGAGLKWAVVGLLAIAAIVVVPRILGRR